MDGQPTPTNFITSMYGRNNFEKFLNAVIRGGGVLYWDKNRSQDLLTAARVQFPAGMRDLASNSIIRKIGGSVNENRSRPLSSVARVQSPAALTASASDTTISQPGTDVNGESGSGQPRFSIDGKPLADPLYSQMENAILDFKGEKIGAQSLVSYLKGHGVKDEEIKWSGITGFLEGKKSVPKQELVDFLRANELVIEDTVLGDGYDKKTQAKLDAQEEQLDELVNGMREKAAVIFPDEDPTDWSPYQLTNALRDRFLNSEIDASSQEMTDVLTEAFKLSSEYDTLKRRHERDIETALNAIDPVYEEYKLDGGENYREILFRLPNAEDTPHSPHWEQDDTLAHTRLQDFVDAEGKKVLFVEEVQSDWHQEGREHGYTTEAVDSETFMDRSPEYQEALDNAVNANTKFYEELQRSEFAYLMDEDYHTNSGYDADSWVLRLKAVEDELNLDPSDYFIAKALSKQNGTSLREAALNAGFDPATTAAIIATDFSAQGSFTDPYTPGYEYVLSSAQKERYESMFREKFVAAYTEYGLERLTGTELSDEVSDLVSEVNAEVKREMSNWLYGQGISPTQKK